jgi:hypothetical protein
LFEVVAADVLGEFAAEPHDVAGGGDQLEAEDVAAGDAVLDGFAAAGVLGDVAADLAGFDAHGVAGEEEAVFGDQVGEVVGDHAGLYGDGHVVEVEVDEFVHAFEADEDAAEDGDGAAGEAAAGAAGGDGDAFAVGEADDGGDLFGGGGEDDASGAWAYSSMLVSSWA